MKNKKAFEVQFNWIFVLIAGAAILVLVSFIIFKQKSISESSSSTIALRSMESVISSASASTDTASVITVPDFSIEAGCGRISLGKASKQYPRLILFSPSSIKGNKIIAQTLSFNAPYKSSNLLFITSQRARYILVGDSVLMKSINNSLPSGMAKENITTYDPSKIRDMNNYNVRIIFEDANVPPNTPFRMPDGDMTALKITGNLDKGRIDFYENRGTSFISKGASHYIGKAALIAAVYSDSKENYECSMRNAFARHESVSRVYANRLSNLNNMIALSSECKNIYLNSIPILISLQQYSTELSKSISEPYANDLASGSGMLKIQNKEAQKFSCPTIY